MNTGGWRRLTGGIGTLFVAGPTFQCRSTCLIRLARLFRQLIVADACPRSRSRLHPDSPDRCEKPATFSQGNSCVGGQPEQGKGGDRELVASPRRAGDEDQLQQQCCQWISLDDQGLPMDQSLLRPHQRAAATAAFVRLLRTKAQAFRTLDSLHPCSTGPAHFCLSRNLAETGETDFGLWMFAGGIRRRKHRNRAASSF